MDGTAVNFFQLICPHEAGTWDPNYTPGVDFLDHDFLQSKKFKSSLKRIYNPITAMGFSAMFTFQLDNTKR
jgi:hypothetical protein